MSRLVLALLGKLACLTGNHAWTCKANEGIPPGPEIQRLSLTAGHAVAFKLYAQGYCKRCGRLL